MEKGKGACCRRKQALRVCRHNNTAAIWLVLLAVATSSKVAAFLPSKGVLPTHPLRNSQTRMHPSLLLTNRRSSRLHLNQKSFLDLLLRRFEQADKTELRNDATLVACYVLCRFLVYDITSGAKIQPGWELQDWVWLTGTFSSAVVLVLYYTIAGLLSRSFDLDRPPTWLSEGTDAEDLSASVVRALVNVALCCPVWLATEHFLGFGPSDIGGSTLSVAVATGFLGFGSFMALAKALTYGMR